MDLRRSLEQMGTREPASDEVLRTAESELHCRLPADYVDLLRLCNGAEGGVGEAGYLVLWPVDELRTANSDYAVEESAPGLLLFGSDGGDTGYAFDTTNEVSVVEVPFIAMSRREARVLAPSFSKFIERLQEET